MPVAATRRVPTFALPALLLLAAVPARAQEDRNLEIGLGLAGASLTTASGESVFSAGMPAGKAAYATLFLSSRLAFEPQAAIAFVAADGDSVHVLGLAGQIDFFLGDRNESAAFVFGRGQFDRIGGGGGGNNGFAAGGGLGYRILLGDRGVLRLEGRFDHGFESDDRSSTNTFTAAVVVGVRL